MSSHASASAEASDPGETDASASIGSTAAPSACMRAPRGGFLAHSAPAPAEAAPALEGALRDLDDGPGAEHAQQPSDRDEGEATRAAHRPAGAHADPRSRAQKRNAKRRAAKKAQRAELLEVGDEMRAISGVQLLHFENLPERMPAAELGSDVPLRVAAPASASASASSSSAGARAACPARPHGMRALYPGPPGWLVDPGAFVRSVPALAAGLPPAAVRMTTSTYLNQRLLDERWAFLHSVYKQPGRAPSLTLTEHKAIYDEAGLSFGDGKRVPAQARLTFSELMRVRPSVHVIPPYTLRRDGVPRECDECHRPCRSECACGEAYCSVECQTKDWPFHKEACDAVCENHPVAMRLTEAYWKRQEQRGAGAGLGGAFESKEHEPVAAVSSQSSGSPSVAPATGASSSSSASEAASTFPSRPADLPPLYPGFPMWLLNVLPFLQQLGMEASAELHDEFARFYERRKLNDRQAMMTQVYSDASASTPLPLAQHVELLARCGWALPSAAHRRLTALQQPLTLRDVLSGVRPGQLEPVSPFQFPADWQRGCGHCHALTSSECACGAAFCSVACQASAWASHCAECARVAATFPNALMFTRLFWADEETLQLVRGVVGEKRAPQAKAKGRER